MSGFVTFFGYRVARCHLSPRLREGLCLKAWLLPRDASSVMVFADAVGKVCGAALCWEAELAREEAVAINAGKVCLFHMHSSGFKALFRQPHSSRSAVKSSGFFFFLLPLSQGGREHSCEPYSSAHIHVRALTVRLVPELGKPSCTILFYFFNNNHSSKDVRHLKF